MSILRVWFKLLRRGNPLVFPMDTSYKECTYEDINRLMVEFAAYGFKWLPEVFDCDDFAWVFKAMASKKGLPVGFVVGWHNGMHCWNCYITDKAHFIEPQNGVVDSKGYIPFWTII